MKTLAAAAVVGALLGVGLTHWHYSPRLAAAQAAVERSAALLAEQGRAIETLRVEGDKRAAESSAALKRAETARRAAERQAQELLARPLPPGTDACAAASALIREELGR